MTKDRTIKIKANIKQTWGIEEELRPAVGRAGARLGHFPGGPKGLY